MGETAVVTGAAEAAAIATSSGGVVAGSAGARAKIGPAPTAGTRCGRPVTRVGVASPLWTPPSGPWKAAGPTATTARARASLETGTARVAMTSVSHRGTTAESAARLSPTACNTRMGGMAALEDTMMVVVVGIMITECMGEGATLAQAATAAAASITATMATAGRDTPGNQQATMIIPTVEDHREEDMVEGGSREASPEIGPAHSAMSTVLRLGPTAAGATRPR